MSMMQPPPDQGAPAPDQGGTGMSPEDHLRAAIEHLQAAQVSEKDDTDSQALAACASKLYQIFANRQKQHDQMLGGAPGMARALSRGY